LEVGSTLGSRTLLHLRFEGGIARWPYDSEDIYIYVVIDERELAADILGAGLDEC